MDKIASFKIDHMRLVPGIYVSRVDWVGGYPVTTLDIRVKRPNFEPAMSPAVSHTIEHLGATFLRNHPTWAENIIYFGPMGCLTGFYLIVNGYYGKDNMEPVVSLVISMMRFVVDYRGNMETVGFDPEQCGNYSLNDIEGAKDVCANFIAIDDAFSGLKFEYPTAENSPEIGTSTRISGDDKINKILAECRKRRQEIVIDYEKYYGKLPEPPVPCPPDMLKDDHSYIFPAKEEPDKEPEITIEELKRFLNESDAAAEKTEAPASTGGGNTSKKKSVLRHSELF